MKKMNINIIVEALGSEDCILEHTVIIDACFVPRVGDSIYLLDFPDRAWNKDEWSEWGMVIDVWYCLLDLGEMSIKLKAEQSHQDKEAEVL